MLENLAKDDKGFRSCSPWRWIPITATTLVLLLAFEAPAFSNTCHAALFRPVTDLPSYDGIDPSETAIGAPPLYAIPRGSSQRIHDDFHSTVSHFMLQPGALIGVGDVEEFIDR
jgi:hypothetical protein